MDVFLSNSFDSEKTSKRPNLISESFNNLAHRRERSNSFSLKKCHNFLEDLSTEQSIKSSKSKNFTINSLNKNFPKENLFKNDYLRKDLYGNVIEKRGKHKVSFRDDIKGKLLVQMTLIDTKQNSIRSRNYKNHTIYLEAKDKENVICSGLCNIF